MKKIFSTGFWELVLNIVFVLGGAVTIDSCQNNHCEMRLTLGSKIASDLRFKSNNLMFKSQ